jgi:hypothetical protein
MIEIEICSPAESDENNVVAVHTDVQRDLRQLCGGRLLYTGRAAAALLRVQAWAEEMILGERQIDSAWLTRQYLGALLAR